MSILTVLLIIIVVLLSSRSRTAASSTPKGPHCGGPPAQHVSPLGQSGCRPTPNAASSSRMSGALCRFHDSAVYQSPVWRS
jgi:hypothetical protein